MNERAPASKLPAPRRVGLVLGAGGPVGHAFHAGVLRALQRGLGWDARRADLIVGTSAGAQVGALMRAGLDGEDLAARVCGDPMRDRAREVARHWVRPCHRTPDADLPRSRMPAAPGMLLDALRRPSRFGLGRVFAALSPEGRVRLDAQSEGLQRLFGHSWPERGLWITSVHLDSGDRVAFGAPGAPPIDVGTAVTCSGAVPGVHVPVQWGGKRYVDGGMHSLTHLDLLDGVGLDLVVVLSPLSMFAPLRMLLRREVGRLARAVPVLAFEPRAAALRVMGYNPMDTERAARVARAACDDTLRELDRPDHASRLDLLA